MSYYVYILANGTKSGLYTGFTRDLVHRVGQHKRREIPGFTSRYNVDQLVYYEEYETAYEGIQREKQLKAGSRRKKMQLIDGFNTSWRDLYPEFIAGEPSAERSRSS